MKIEQGTVRICCATCAAYQLPDGGDTGLCFELRHKRKRALFVREGNVCVYWHAADHRAENYGEVLAPVLLTDRVFAALVFSLGGAPRSVREICDWIEEQFKAGPVLAADVARVLQHQVGCGRLRFDVESRFVEKLETWSAQVEAILDLRNTPVRFEISAATVARFLEVFAAWRPLGAAPKVTFDHASEVRDFHAMIAKEDEQKAARRKARAAAAAER